MTIKIVLLTALLFLPGNTRETQFVQPFSPDSEADEDDCAGDGPADAAAIAKAHPASPCGALVDSRK